MRSRRGGGRAAAAMRWHLARMVMKPRMRELVKTGRAKVFIEDVKQTRDTWGKAFVQYVITISCGKAQWKIYARYSEFISLRRAMTHYINRHRLPKLPGKKLSFLMTEENIQQRRRGLELFLNRVISLPKARAARNPELLEFLGFLAGREDAMRDIDNVEAWNASYVSKIPPWLYMLKALLPSQGERVPIGLLRVNVISAKNLPRMDLIGSSDPYVVLKLGTRVPQESKTKVITNTLNPCWEENFVFEVTNATSVLRVEVWDDDMVGENDQIGYFDIALKHLAHEEIVTGDFFLKPVASEDVDEEEDEKGDAKKPKKDKVWESKNPPRVRLQLRYCFSRLGEMASHWNPEPAPEVPEPKFQIDELYKQVKVLMINIRPIINFFYAIYLVLKWDDIYYSTWITGCFVVVCYHPWVLAILIQGWLIYYTLTKYVAYAWKQAHYKEGDEKMPPNIPGSSHVVTAAAHEEKADYKLGMVGGTLTMAIKAADYVDDMRYYQNSMAAANSGIEAIYGLFDWSSPGTSRGVLIVLCCTFVYCLFLPVHYISLTMGLCLLFMWTSPFIFLKWMLSGFGRYLGREKVTSAKMRGKWKNVIIGAKRLSREMKEGKQ